MSQSPLDAADAGQTKRYLAGWSALRRLIAQGKSISGNERHCSFLNVEHSRFADVSAATGLDLADDGRAVGLTDWDHDGDEDIWLTNRTSPSVRFLRNDLNAGNHYIAIRLVGSECNRDAIGARVELFAESGDKAPLMKTLRAGSGFLSQSSKWLHLGLGQSQHIDRVVVHWPGGEAETFDGLKVNSRVRFVQGTGKPVRIEPRERAVELEASDPPKPVAESAFRVVTLPGFAPRLANVGRGPLLVTLWAGWCQPCLLELEEIAQRQNDLRSAGLQVLAINVDSVDSPEDFNNAEAGELLQRIRFPFPSSRADANQMEGFEAARQALVDKPGTFALPTSFLVDQEQRVRVMYRGRLKVDQLLGDLHVLRASTDRLRDASVPFKGKWLGPPPLGR